MISTAYLVVACTFAALATFIISLCARPIATALGLLDKPGGLKHHREPTPLMGGIMLMAVLTPILVAYMLGYEPIGIGHWALASFALVMLGCALLGTVDDHRHIPAFPRFLIALALFSALLIVEPRFQLTSLSFSGLASPLPLGVWDGAAFTLFVLIGFMNAVNMADGKNGLVIGMSVIWSAVLAIIGPTGLASVLVPLCVSLIVLIVFNLRGKLFLGDGGTYGLAALIGLAATYSYNFNGGAVKADALILLFVIPVADMMRLIALRLADGRSPMSGDREHLHHYLLSLCGWPAGLLVYIGLVLVPNAVATWRPDFVPAMLLLSLIAYGGTVLLCRIERRRAAVTPAE